MRVRFTPSARAEFLNALEFIRREDPDAAAHFRHRSERGLRRLERYPNSGRKLPEFPDLPHREVMVRPYGFFYRVCRQTVRIVVVRHGAQGIEQPADAPRRPRR